MRIPTVDATPWFSEPAPDVVVEEVVIDTSRAVLDPCAVYSQGENVRRQELAALSGDQLRNILRAYMSESPDLYGLTESEPREGIVALARGWALGMRGTGREPDARSGV